MSVNNFKICDAIELVDTSGNKTTINQLGFTNTLAGVNVTWQQINNLETATSALVYPDSANIFAVNNTFEANDNYLAKTRTAVLSALPSVPPSLVLNDILNGVVNTINSTGYTTKNTTANVSHYLNFSDSSSTGVGAIQKTAGINCNPSTNTITATTFSGDLNGNVLIQDDNTNATFYPVFVSNNTGKLPLKVDKTTNPLSYNPSTGIMTATGFSGGILTTSDNTNTTCYIPFTKSTAGNTPLYLDDTTTPLSYNPSTSTLSATIFSTAIAPVSGSQLGNKTYINNFGGGAGWYYTASVNNGGASSTTFAFPNCFSANLNNAYEVYFIFNFSAPTTGYISCNMSFTGLGTTTYYNWTTTTSNSATPTITNAYTTANQYLTLLTSMDATNAYYIRSATPKINIWGAISNSGGAGISQTQFLAENLGSANPGITGMYKTFGYTQQLTGYITGTTLTFSSAMTGTATIIVKGKS